MSVLGHTDRRMLWKSRETIIEMMKDRKYTDLQGQISMSFVDFSEWVGDDEEDVVMDAMTIEGLTKTTKTTKTKVSRKCKVAWVMKPTIAILTSFSSLHTEGGYTTVILVCKQPAKHQGMKGVADLHSMGIHVEMFSVAELQYNLTRHKDVPRHVIVSKKMKKELITAYGDKSCIMRIHNTDPVIRYLGGRKGDLVEINEPSITQPGYCDLVFKLVV